MNLLLPQLLFAICTLATPIIYEGRASLSLRDSDLDASSGPYLTVVKGDAQNASYYSHLLGRNASTTPLWSKRTLSPLIAIQEQVISVTIDNSSVFMPGGSPQYGFRRTELIAQKNGSPSGLNAEMEVGVTVFHFSIKLNERLPLNYDHEYQVVFIEPSDGSHVFGIQLGSPFTNPTGPLPSRDAHFFKVLDHGWNLIYSVPFTPRNWHNFAIRVDWDERTLSVFYSKDGQRLAPVTDVVPNPIAPGPAGQGDFHFGVLKLPLVNPADAPEYQGDVVHHGIQEGTKEGLFYSGVFVERVSSGISLGN